MKLLLIKVFLSDFTKGFIFSKPKKKFAAGIQSSYLPPLGILYIARSLEDEGHTVEVIDLYCEEEPEGILEKSLPHADAVGLSVYSDDYKDSAYIANLIKRYDSDLPIVIGGPHCTYQSENALANIPSADISIEGDGELVIKDVVKALQGTKKLSNIAGICYRENGKIKNAKPPILLKDLDSISFPSRHLVDKYDYGKVYNLYYRKPKLTSIATSRGCPFHCRFCNRDYKKIVSYRKRSAENVIEEFCEINDKYNSVAIVDDNFLLDKKIVNKILDGIIENKLDLEMYIKARVDSADRDLYKKMKKAGIKRIFFGIESGNQDTLDFYNKRTNLNQIRKAVKLADEMDFFTIGSFVLGAPIETEKHLENTIKFACSLPLKIALWEHLRYKFGSPLWKEAVREGKISKNEYMVLADSQIGLGNLPKKKIEKYCKNAFKKFYFRPEYFAKSVLPSIVKGDFTHFKIGLDLFKPSTFSFLTKP